MNVLPDLFADLKDHFVLSGYLTEPLENLLGVDSEVSILLVGNGQYDTYARYNNSLTLDEIVKWVQSGPEMVQLTNFKGLDK